MIVPLSYNLIIIIMIVDWGFSTFRSPSVLRRGRGPARRYLYNKKLMWAYMAAIVIIGRTRIRCRTYIYSLQACSRLWFFSTYITLFVLLLPSCNFIHILVIFVLLFFSTYLHNGILDTILQESAILWACNSSWKWCILSVLWDG